MSRLVPVVLLLAAASTLAACGQTTSQARLLAQLKAGDPAACGAPPTLETLTAIIEQYSKDQDATHYGSEGSDELEPGEAEMVRQHRPIKIMSPVAERVDKLAQKMTCSGTISFTSDKETFEKVALYDVVVDQSGAAPLIRLNGAKDFQEKYVANFRSYLAIEGRPSKSDLNNARLAEHAAWKEEHAPDMDDEDYATGWETKRAPYPQLLDADRRRVAWLRDHCSDPTDGRGATQVDFGHELDSNVRSVYLKMKREHPEIVTATDTKCFKSTDTDWHRYNVDKAKERAEGLTS